MAAPDAGATAAPTPSRLPGLALKLAALAAALAVPLATNEYTQYVCNLIVVYALVGTGFNIVIGYLGQLAFANAALFGIGAYATAIPMARLGIPFPLALAFGGVMGAAVGALVSVPALRGIRDYYLAILTMAFGELLRFVYIHADVLTNGSTGLEVPRASVFGAPLRTQTEMYYAFLAVTVAVLAASASLLKSRFGRAIAATRDDELAAAALGVPTSGYVVFAFAWSGFVVGLAGGMFAILIGRVVPESFNLTQLILHFAIVIVGGVGTLAGPILGAIVLTAQPELLRGFPGADEIVFGTLIALVLVFLPRGLVGLLERVSPSLAERLARRPA